ncbi:hypothetical protein [Mesorhizobium sp.]|nr:hypothetical protein [Mesorhizobium sp.]
MAKSPMPSSVSGVPPAEYKDARYVLRVDDIAEVRFLLFDEVGAA